MINATLFSIIHNTLSAKGISVTAVHQGNIVGSDMRWPFLRGDDVLVAHKGRFFQVIPGRNGRALFIDLANPVGDQRAMKAAGAVRAAKFSDFGKKTRQDLTAEQDMPATSAKPVEQAAFTDGRKTMSLAKAQGLHKAQLTKAAKARAAGKTIVAEKAEKAAATIYARYLLGATIPVEQPKADPKAALVDALRGLSKDEIAALLTEVFAA